ncbi:hypothetical protein AYI68_g1515 [Smittium mucronatum]|uniref:Uncharacterized protein n=1 Tax=Smittium mucronatum TaxID=133383 RepID=A0A1R0H593_9FUNG|nr:hypothetical protein AYI68_g1515 [Smittium mucronatum]
MADSTVAEPPVIVETGADIDDKNFDFAGKVCPTHPSFLIGNQEKSDSEFEKFWEYLENWVSNPIAFTSAGLTVEHDMPSQG